MHKRICAVCGTHYSYCPTCEADRFKPSWMMSFHDENCREVWRILSAVNCHTMEESEAIEALNNLDLSNRSNFNEAIASQIDRLLGKKSQADGLFGKKKAKAAKEN